MPDFDKLSPTLTTIGYSEFHHFVHKTQLKPKPCIICLRQIKCGVEVLRCVFCNLLCHPHCEKYLSSICTGEIELRKRKPASSHAITYPMKPPFIPFPVLHLINEIEFQTQRPYFGTSSRECQTPVKADVQKVLERFRRSKPQHLRRYTLRTLRACLMAVLQNLEGAPLIRHWNWNVQDSKLSFESLPIPQRSTLAFLLLHIQQVYAPRVSSKKMSGYSLKIFDEDFTTVLIETEHYQSRKAKKLDLDKQLTTLASKHSLMLDLLQNDSNYLVEIVK